MLLIQEKYCNKNYVNRHWVMFTGEVGVLLLTCVLCCRFSFTNLFYFAGVDCGGEDNDSFREEKKKKTLQICKSVHGQLLYGTDFAMRVCLDGKERLQIRSR
jgi:hypothetical protein